jgi:hypothetical protein
VAVTTDDDRSLRDRILGRSRNGTVTLRDFDAGVVLTMGAQQGEGSFSRYYFLPAIPGVCPPRGLPGIPIVFSTSEDVFTEYVIPQVVVTREDIAPAMQRWHPGARQYRVPGLGVAQVEGGYEAYEEMTSAVPYDFTYQISVEARNRGGVGTEVRSQANAVFMYVLSIYQPYSLVRVVDSIGDTRRYEAFGDSLSMLDEVLDVTDRTVGFGISLRVEGELDLNVPWTYPAVTQAPTIRETLKDG